MPKLGRRKEGLRTKILLRSGEKNKKHCTKLVKLQEFSCHWSIPLRDRFASTLMKLSGFTEQFDPETKSSKIFSRWEFLAKSSVRNWDHWWWLYGKIWGTGSKRRDRYVTLHFCLPFRRDDQIIIINKFTYKKHKNSLKT